MHGWPLYNLRRISLNPIINIIVFVVIFVLILGGSGVGRYLFILEITLEQLITIFIYELLEYEFDDKFIL